MSSLSRGSFYEIRGRLRGRSHAEGGITYVDDPVNPQGQVRPRTVACIALAGRRRASMAKRYRRAGVGLGVLGVVVLSLLGMTEPSSASRGSAGGLHPVGSSPVDKSCACKAAAAQHREVTSRLEVLPGLSRLVEK
jgi:hypothetical protein